MRKTIYFGKKDPQLKKLVEQCEDYLVSDMVKSLMKDGLKYRELLEGNKQVLLPSIEPVKKEVEKPVIEHIDEEDDDFVVDLGDLKAEKEEKSEKNNDLYDKLSQL